MSRGAEADDQSGMRQKRVQLAEFGDLAGRQSPSNPSRYSSLSHTFPTKDTKKQLVSSQLPAASGGIMFNTVLVAADDSVTAARAVSTAVELVKTTGGSLHVMTAYNPSLSYSDMVVPNDYIESVTDAADLLSKTSAGVLSMLGSKLATTPRPGRSARRSSEWPTKSVPT